MSQQQEQARLAALRRHDILDTPAEESCDRYARFAACLFRAPIGLVSLVDAHRQWFKAAVGLCLTQTERRLAFADHTIRSGEILVVPDLAADPRFADNPLVTGPPHARFYAGAPLIDSGGHALGSLCVLDTRPREPPDGGILDRFEDLARAVTTGIELRTALAGARGTAAVLRGGDGLLRAISETVHTGIAVTGADGRLDEVNPYFCAMAGFRREDLLGRAMAELIHAADRKAFERFAEDALARSTGGLAEMRLAAGDGRVVEIALAARPFPEIQAPQRLLLACDDVGEQRRAQRLSTRRAGILEGIVRQAPPAETVARICQALEDHFTDSRALVVRIPGAYSSWGILPEAAGEDRLLRDCLLDPERGVIAGLPGGGRRPPRELEIRRFPERCRRRFRQLGFGSVSVQPVTGRDDTLRGVLVLLRRYSSGLRQDCRRLMREMGDLVALALTHAELADGRADSGGRDPLTGLADRSRLLEHLGQVLAESRRLGGRVAVMVLDLDDFKLVNDSLGHEVGDRLLLEVAERLRISVRETELVARLGGDEFVVVARVPERRHALGVGRKILQRLGDEVLVSGQRLCTPPSIGVALFPDDGDEPGELLRAADTAMYAAKQDGKNGMRFFNASMSEAARLMLETGRLLSDALRRQDGALHAHFQPRLDVVGGRLLGVEAFARWRHPERGLLTASQFLEAAEQAGLLPDIDRLVLRLGLDRLARWRRDHPDLRLFWNLCAGTLRDPGLPALLEELLTRHDLPASALELGVLEGQVVRNLRHSLRQLETLRRQFPGLRLALDDFGIHHGALATLRQLPVDALKVDRRFLADLREGGEEDRGMAMLFLNTLRTVAAQLGGLDTIIEGVEQEREFRLLRRLGCDIMQGRFFLPPMADPLPRFPELLDRLRLDRPRAATDSTAP